MIDSTPLSLDRRYILGLIVGILVFASGVLYWIRVVPDNIAILGLGIVWISLSPGLIYLFAPKIAPIPFFPAVGVFYAVFFGLPVFTIPLAWNDPSSIILYNLVSISVIRAEVLAIVIAGIFALVVAYFGCRHFLFHRISPFKLAPIIQKVNYSPLLWLLLIGHLIPEYIPALSNIPSLGQFLGPVGYLAFGGFFLLWRRGELFKIETILLIFIFLPLEIYWRIRILFLTDIILFLIFVSFILWRERLYKIYGLSIVLISFLLTVYGASTVMRSSFSSGSEKLLETGKAFVVLTFQNKNEFTHQRGYTYTFAGKFGSLVKRTGHLWVFHVVADKSPNPVPYWGGGSYRPILTSFIPRIVYPNKPEERAGGKFGRQYGFVPPKSFGTSINIPWITELLVNFGPWGVIWGMSLIGAFLGFLDRVFNSRETTDLDFAFGLTLIFPLIYPESNVSVMIGSMLPLFVALYIYIVGGGWVLSKITLFQRKQPNHFETVPKNRTDC